jgi:anaerobic ribonucleoside-triphosphate reductase activating protein
MNYAEIKKYDIANGPGLRISLFVSGCTHQCKNCFNQDLWDPNYGKPYTKKVEDEILEFLSSRYVSGLSLLGGDPLDYKNYKELIPLAKKTKEMGKTVWCYTGSLAEDLMKKSLTDTKLREFLSYIDVLVDGPFIEELKDPTLKFRGSSNQRLLDCHELFNPNIKEWEDQDKKKNTSWIPGPSNTTCNIPVRRDLI